jgi:hypothetical protein
MMMISSVVLSTLASCVLGPHYVAAFEFRSKSTRGSLGPNFPATQINRVVPTDLATSKFDGQLLGGEFPRGPAPPHAARFCPHCVDFKRRRIRFVSAGVLSSSFIRPAAFIHLILLAVGTLD